jgi:hypothetical protein
VAKEELMRLAVEALRDIDSRALFWVDLGVATREGATAEGIAWNALDWEKIRADLDQWLRSLDPTSCPTSYQVPISDEVMLVFQVRARAEAARGWKSKPTFTLAETIVPTIWLDGEEEASLYDLPIDTVEALATGRRKMALELQSHQETWAMLLGEMNRFGQKSTAEIDPMVLESYASMLGLTEAPPDLGDFDEGWRAINRP